MPKKQQITTAPKVAVIILNWKNAPMTADCVKQVLASDYANLTVIAVDNGSPDGSGEVLRKQFLQLEFIQTGENLGYAGGNNKGIKRALELGAQFALILNNDCMVEKSCISHLVKVAIEDGSIGMVSPKVYEYDRVISHAGSLLNWSDNFLTKSIGAGQVDVGQYDQQKELETATGDCLLISADLINTVGLIDESYFLYYEDTDWCFRARLADFKIIYAPLAQATHPGSLSTGGVNKPLGAYYVLRNKFYFVCRYGSVGARCRNWIHFVLSFIKNSLKMLNANNRVVAKARLRALRDAVLGVRGKVSI